MCGYRLGAFHESENFHTPNSDHPYPKCEFRLSGYSRSWRPISRMVGELSYLLYFRVYFLKSVDTTYLEKHGLFPE